MANGAKCKKTMWKLFVRTYLIPGAVLYSILYMTDSAVTEISKFIFAYLVVVTMINFCYVAEILLGAHESNDSVSLEVESPPSGTPTDSPPTYWEAVKDPPSYSFLQYYRRMMSSKSWIQRNNSLEKHNSSGSTSIPQTPSSTARNPKFNRNVSCPA